MTYNELTPHDVPPVQYTDVDIDNIDLHYYTKLAPKQLMKSGPTNGNKYRAAENHRGSVYENKIPMSFDIETTGVTTRGDDGKIITAHAYMYKWQYGLGDTIIHGRSYTQLLELFNAMAENNQRPLICRILVANLGYEFQFINHHLQNDGWKCKVFARVAREPITATFSKNGFWLMFADALQITNCSLEKMAKNYNLPSKKQSGDLDYTIPRNSKTPLTAAELGYCSYDCRVLNDFYRWIIVNYVENGLKFPLTSTGLVRSDMKYYCRQFEMTTRTDPKTHKTYYNKSAFISRILPEMWPTYAEYCELMALGYSGGYTHANILHTGVICENVNGGDFTSSYPYTIMFQKFPMTPFIRDSRIKTVDNIISANNNGWAVLAKIRFENFEQTTTQSTISITKCAEYLDCGSSASKTQERINGLVDNGRVMYASSITLMVTDIDLLENLMRFYRWTRAEIIWAKISRYGYLPDYVRYSCARFCERKQKLKRTGQDGTTAYRLAKSMVNSVYGLMVQKLNIIEMTYDGNSWGPQIETFPGLTAEQNAELAYVKSLHNSRGEFNQILSPYWGVWVTSHARGNLFTILSQIGADAIYCDTDSIYYYNPDKWSQMIDDYNQRIEKQNVAIIEKWNAQHDEQHQLDPECFRNLGTFDKLLKTGNYVKFKTLGAKRYIKQWYDNGELKTEQTIAGLPKTALAKYCAEQNVDPFELFDDGMKIPDCKNAHAYTDKPHSDTITDSHGNTETMSELSSVGIFSIDFTLGLTDEYLKMVVHYAEKRMKQDYKTLYNMLGGDE